jgi:hypothetical protein
VRACTVDGSSGRGRTQLVRLPRCTRADATALCAVLEECGGIWSTADLAYVFDPKLISVRENVVVIDLLQRVADTQTTIPPRTY